MFFPLLGASDAKEITTKNLAKKDKKTLKVISKLIKNDAKNGRSCCVLWINSDYYSDNITICDDSYIVSAIVINTLLSWGYQITFISSDDELKDGGNNIQDYLSDQELKEIKVQYGYRIILRW